MYAAGDRIKYRLTMNEARLTKWAKAHKKNPNTIIRMYKKMNVLEKWMFQDEIKHERNTQDKRSA
jgi:hypothetical protein